MIFPNTIAAGYHNRHTHNTPSHRALAGQQLLAGGLGFEGSSSWPFPTTTTNTTAHH